MKKRLVLVLAILGFSLLLAGCSPKTNLDGTKWSLVSLAGQAVLADTKVTLNFEKDTLGGSDGCNLYSTSYTLQGSQIRLDKNIISTLMACTESVTAQADAFMQALLKTDSLRVSGSQLSLIDARGQVLAVFEQTNGD